jgi:hypothetical protein
VPKPKRAKAPKEPAKTATIWNVYCQLRLQKHFVEPTHNAKTRSMLLQLIKNYGEETAIKLIEFYLNHPQSFYVIRGHPLELCVKDGDWLLTQMKAGQALKDADIRTYREKQLKPKWDSRGVWDLEELERLYQQRCGKN